MTAAIDRSIGVAESLALWGESIEIWPAGVEANKRTVLAVIDREMPSPVPGGAGGLAPGLSIRLANDGATGVTAAELNTATWLAKVARRYGGTAIAMRMGKILGQDGGVLHVELT